MIILGACAKSEAFVGNNTRLIYLLDTLRGYVGFHAAVVEQNSVEVVGQNIGDLASKKSASALVVRHNFVADLERHLQDETGGTAK